MKIHILYDIRSGPWGGGNQFLLALRRHLESQSNYAETPEEADVLLFDSHHDIIKVAQAKRRFPNTPFIHRIGGPMRLYNRMSDRRDFVVNVANRLIADGTVFQSDWSREKNLSLGLVPSPFETIITNAPNPKIFYDDGKTPFSSRGKVRLIAASWSNNKNKGFDVYRWLDENLDFSRYEMVFVGNSPVRFRNIRQVSPMKPEGIAKELKKNDIYITASKVEACSNALVEALHCGLIALAIYNTSHEESIGGRGEIFKNPEDIPGLMEKIVTNKHKYLAQPFPPSIKEVGSKYYAFAQSILDYVERKEYCPKRLLPWQDLRLKGTLIALKLHERKRTLLRGFVGAEDRV